MSGKELYNYASLIRKVTLAADATSITLDNLNLDPRKVYKLFYNLRNVNPAGGILIDIHFNNDLVDANYFRTEAISIAGAGWADAWANNPIIAGPPLTNDIEIGDMTILCDLDGRPRLLLQVNAWEGIALVLELKSLLYDVCVPSITRIDLIANVANSIGAGSIVSLFGLET